MSETCWSCGHWLIGFGCTKDGTSTDKVNPTEHDYTCDDWVEEGTKGTITDYGQE